MNNYYIVIVAAAMLLMLGLLSLPTQNLTMEEAFEGQFYVEDTFEFPGEYFNSTCTSQKLNSDYWKTEAVNGSTIATYKGGDRSEPDFDKFQPCMKEGYNWTQVKNINVVFSVG